MVTNQEEFQSLRNLLTSSEVVECIFSSIRRRLFFSNRSSSHALCLQRGGHDERLDNDPNQSCSKSQRRPQKQQTAKSSTRTRAVFCHGFTTGRRFGRSEHQQRRDPIHQPELKMVRRLLDEIRECLVVLSIRDYRYDQLLSIISYTSFHERTRALLIQRRRKALHVTDHSLYLC